MIVRGSRRLENLPPYAFAEIDALVGKLQKQGADPIDFGVGDPTVPTPEIVRKAGCIGVERHASAGYPSYIGSQDFRSAAAAWMKRRFDVDLDPATQITSTIGSKEGVFHFPMAVTDPGDVVLCPSPGYPPYGRGTAFAGARPFYYPLTHENGFLPSLRNLPDATARTARILWICYPNSPTGRVAGPAHLESMVSWAQDKGIILASDEAYIDLYFGDTPPQSALSISTDGVIAFFSLSKRSAMTGWRIGWAAGDARLIALFRKLKTNLDSGVPNFVQDAAVAALSDEAHVATMREEYRRKRNLLVDALASTGLPRCEPEGTIYVWQRLPNGLSSQEAAKRLLDPEIAIVATPGNLIAEPLEDGTNPGEGYLRFALVPSMERMRMAVDRLSRLRW